MTDATQAAPQPSLLDRYSPSQIIEAAARVLGGVWRYDDLKPLNESLNANASSTYFFSLMQTLRKIEKGIPLDGHDKTVLRDQDNQLRPGFVSFNKEELVTALPKLAQSLAAAKRNNPYALHLQNFRPEILDNPEAFIAALNEMHHGIYQARFKPVTSAPGQPARALIEKALEANQDGTYPPVEILYNKLSNLRSTAAMNNTVAFWRDLSERSKSASHASRLGTPDRDWRDGLLAQTAPSVRLG